MKIIIPIGGIGQRFKDEGFELPKPLININGKSMISHLIESLNLSEEDEIYIVYNNFLKNFNFENLITFNFPKIKINFHCLINETKGASETVLTLLNEFNDIDLNSRFLILDCDTFYGENIIHLFKENLNGNIIFYFNDFDDNPIFSYISLNEEGRVISIKEKNKISNNASVGAYGFENGKILKEYCEKVFGDDGELYISKIYEKLLQDNIYVDSKKIDKFNCVGTPIQLKVFASSNNTNKLRFCFDLDNTLVTHPLIHGDYTTVKPIWKNIEYLKFLKTLGHTIIIYTARRMKTHKGNVGAIISDIGKITIETLEKFEIPYDELFFGKPYANFYIDDLAVNANSDIDKFIGIYDIHSKPREFNDVKFNNEFVEKETNNIGECYWYQNIPENILQLFPKVYKVSGNKLIIEKIDGVSFSYLYVNKLLGAEDIKKLISYVKKIHSSIPYDKKINIYGNYNKKIIDRYQEYNYIYKKYDLDDVFNVLINLLSLYEKNDEGSHGVVHGDCVFTNILHSINGDLKFIDMRGKVGDNLTIFGDIFYDFSKIYQSLIGYDFILNNLEIDFTYTKKLIEYFESLFTENEMRNIKVITASLFFSLLPLHQENEEKFKKYILLIKKLINQ
jgi:capsule biosynthesis phosphatase